MANREKKILSNIVASSVDSVKKQANYLAPDYKITHIKKNPSGTYSVFGTKK
jgi:hypothetical protein